MHFYLCNIVVMEEANSPTPSDEQKLDDGKEKKKLDDRKEKKKSDDWKEEKKLDDRKEEKKKAEGKSDHKTPKKLDNATTSSDQKIAQSYFWKKDENTSSNTLNGSSNVEQAESDKDRRCVNNVRIVEDSDSDIEITGIEISPKKKLETSRNKLQNTLRRLEICSVDPKKHWVSPEKLDMKYKGRHLSVGEYKHSKEIHEKGDKKHSSNVKSEDRNNISLSFTDNEFLNSNVRKTNETAQPTIVIPTKYKKKSDNSGAPSSSGALVVDLEALLSPSVLEPLLSNNAGKSPLLSTNVSKKSSLSPHTKSKSGFIHGSETSSSPATPVAIHRNLFASDSKKACETFAQHASQKTVKERLKMKGMPSNLKIKDYSAHHSHGVVDLSSGSSQITKQKLKLKRPSQDSNKHNRSSLSSQNRVHGENNFPSSSHLTLKDRLKLKRTSQDSHRQHQSSDISRSGVVDASDVSSPMMKDRLKLKRSSQDSHRQHTGSVPSHKRVKLDKTALSRGRTHTSVSDDDDDIIVLD